MTEIEAAQKFKVELNKLDRSSAIDVRIEKVLHYLNKAALFLVKAKYKGKDPGPGRLEVNHPVLDDLKILIAEAEPDFTSNLPETIIPFEDDHLYYLSCRVSTTNAVNTTPTWHEGRYVKPERVYRELMSPFDKSVIDDPIVSLSRGKLIVFNTDFTIDDLKIKYLKAPLTITGSGSEMELPFADEIIDVATTMAIENFESERIKTQPGISVASASE
jgi:hypothetical protein